MMCEECGAAIADLDANVKTYDRDGTDEWWCMECICSVVDATTMLTLDELQRRLFGKPE